jgi:hypothetical protein
MLVVETRGLGFKSPNSSPRSCAVAPRPGQEGYVGRLL